MGETILVDIINVDIINKKALTVLQDLEVLQLIRLRKDRQTPLMSTDWATKYKKAMPQQSLREIDEQLRNLRSAWE